MGVLDVIIRYTHQDYESRQGNCISLTPHGIYTMEPEYK